MQKIFPHLWFDKEVKQAVDFYVSVFPESSISSEQTMHDTPGGDTNVITFKLWGHDFQAINGGPYFSFNPSISLMVNFDPSRDPNAREMIDQVWDKLIDGGKALMPIDKYPFSERYGWVQDKYGLTWQLILTDPNGGERPAIIPSMLFVENVYGKAEEAIDFYTSVFRQSQKGTIAKYPAGMEPDREGAVMFADFKLLDTWFAAMDSAREHNYGFNEAVSLVVNCETQEELDYYWQKLSAVPEAEQCGWIKDKYGVSWQIVPTELQELMENATQAQIDAMTQAFLPMKKLDMAEIKRVYEEAGN